MTHDPDIAAVAAGLPLDAEPEAEQEKDKSDGQ